MSKNAIYPATLMTLIAAYIALLAYKASNQSLPTPDYDFYDTTYIHVHISPNDELYDVYGVYNNILEGQRELVKAYISGENVYKLAFQVNSPRPGFVYINNEAINIFLAPDSALHLHVDFNQAVQQIDTISFMGYTAEISRYYKAKSQEFNNVHLRSTRNIIAIDDFCDYSSTLDSISEKERTFLALYNLDRPLPPWFIRFEQSEIGYQKAYLKLAESQSAPQASDCLDQVALNNEQAKFSYYYYLYVKSYIRNYLAENTEEALLNDVETHLSVADTLLDGEVHDLYITRSIFEILRRNRIPQAGKLIRRYQDKFNSKKYLRFLEYQLKQARNPT